MSEGVTFTLASADNICAVCKFGKASGLQINCTLYGRFMNGGDTCNSFRQALKHKDRQT